MSVSNTVSPATLKMQISAAFDRMARARTCAERMRAWSELKRLALVHARTASMVDRALARLQ